MKKSIAPKARKENLVVQEFDGEVLIYDLTTNKAFSLNETSSLVWQLCDGNKSVGEISEGVAKTLNAPADEDLVWLALDQLKKEKLIANGAELESKFEGMSRRDIIKKVGMGTMIALPIVSSLIAPTIASAQSGTCFHIGGGGGNVGGGCASNADCNAGLTCRSAPRPPGDKTPGAPLTCCPS